MFEDPKMEDRGVKGWFNVKLTVEIYLAESKWNIPVKETLNHPWVKELVCEGGENSN